jgi:hypothetical protein
MKWATMRPKSTLTYVRFQAFTANNCAKFFLGGYDDGEDLRIFGFYLNIDKAYLPRRFEHNVNLRSLITSTLNVNCFPEYWTERTRLEF